MALTGWIIYNGSLNSDKFIDYATMLQEAAHRQNSQTIILKNNEVLPILKHQQMELFHEQKLLPDYVIFIDKDIYLANQLELLGVPVFNKARTISISDDKILTYQILAKQHIPMPKTIIAPLSFFKMNPDTFYQLDNIILQLGLPLIVKEAFGSFGEQVYLAHTKEELREIIQNIHGQAFMFQEFITTSYGKDLRLQVVNNQVVAAMKRTSQHDFRANITSGGRMEPYIPTQTEIDLAVASSLAIGADFSGVDLLFGENGQTLVCEINSNAHIRNLYDCTGINAADNMIKHVLTKLSK